MTDMQRWQASMNYLYPVNETTPLHPGRMEVYLASDAEAAIAETIETCRQLLKKIAYETAKDFEYFDEIKQYRKNLVIDFQEALAALQEQP